MQYQSKNKTDYLLDSRPDAFWLRVSKLIQKPSQQGWLNREVYLFLLAIFAGLLGGGIAVAFRKSVELVQWLAYGYRGDLGLFYSGVLTVATWKLWLMPIIGILLCFPIVWIWVPEARGAGIAEVMEASRLHAGRLKKRFFVGKFFATVISLGTLSSLGREGPILSTAAGAGAIVSQTLGIPKSYWNVMIACAGAAGISATFNTPIAGAFFMAEVVLGSFSMDHFPSVILASVLGTVVGQHFFGSNPAFNLPTHFALHHPLELLGFIVLGVLAGLIAVLFMRSINKIRDIFDDLPIPGIAKSLLGGLILIIIGLYICPNVIGSGYTTLEHLIGARAAPGELLHTGWWFLVFLVVFKILAVGISLGAGFSGGVFAPSLFVGAPLGYLVGLIVQRLSLTADIYVSPETYAVIGMAAVFAGVSKAPISAIIMIFEMTQDYQLTLPLMAACVISFVVSRSYYPDSIYVSQLKRKGIDINKLNQEQLLMHHYTVRDLMKKDEEPVVYPDTSIQEASRIMLKYQRHFLFLLSNGGVLEGVITLAHVKSYLLAEETRLYDPISEIIDPRPVFVHPEMPLTDAMQVFWHTHLEELPVIDKASQILVGVIWERDIIGLYNAEILKKQDALGMFTVRDGDQQNYEHLELPKGYTLKKIPVLQHWENKRIMDLALREDWGINILTIERIASNGAVISLPPTGAEVIGSEDHLVIIGPVIQITKLLKELGLSLA